MFVGYFCYLIKLFIWSEGALPYAVAVLVCVILPLAVFLHRKGILGRIFGRAYAGIRTLYAAGLMFYMISFLLLCGFILGGELSETPAEDLPENTAFVVLGAKVEASGQPGAILRRRLDTALGLLSDKPDAKCIVSGAQGSNEPMSEAQSMKNYLVRHGISEDRIILEDESYNTIQNIKNVKAIAEKEGIGALAFVTTNFHVPRVRILCGRIGLDEIETYFYNAPNSSPLMLYTILVREYMSYCKLILFGT